METIYVRMSNFAKLRYLFSQAFLRAIFNLRFCVVLLSIVFISLPFVSLAQTEGKSEPITIHELVGYRISPEEFANYRFTKWVKVKKRDLLYAEIFEPYKGRYEMVFHLKNDTELREQLDKTIISTLKSSIAKEGRKLLQVIDLMSAALNEGEKVEFEMMTKDEKTKTVQLIKDIGESLIVESQGLRQGIPKEDILQIIFEGRIYTAGFVNAYLNPFPDQYMHSYSAIPMQKKQVYVQLTTITMSGINIGLTDNVSASMEIDFLLPLMVNTFFNLFGLENVLSGVIAKGNLRAGFAVKEDLYLGTGVDVLSLPSILGEKPFRSMVPYVVATRGTRENNLSMKLGGILTNYTSDLAGIQWEVNGVKRISKGLSFVSENNLFGSWENSSMGLLTKQGLRIASRKVVLDFGAFSGFAGGSSSSLPDILSASAGASNQFQGDFGFGLFVLVKRTL